GSFGRHGSALLRQRGDRRTTLVPVDPGRGNLMVRHALANLLVEPVAVLAQDARRVPLVGAVPVAGLDRLLVPARTEHQILDIPRQEIAEAALVVAPEGLGLAVALLDRLAPAVLDLDEFLAV